MYVLIQTTLFFNRIGLATSPIPVHAPIPISSLRSYSSRSWQNVSTVRAVYITIPPKFVLDGVPGVPLKMEGGEPQSTAAAAIFFIVASY